MICPSWVGVLAGEMVVQERFQTEYFHLYRDGNAVAIETVVVIVFDDPSYHKLLISMSRLG